MDYVAKTGALLEQVKKSTGIDFKVLKIEWTKESSEYYLRIYCDMDKEGGIGSEDLAAITRPLNKLLDKEDFIDEAYTLEVCSPGYLDAISDAELEKKNADLTDEDLQDVDMEENKDE